MAAWMQQLALGVLCCGMVVLLLLLLHWAEDGADPGDGAASCHAVMRLSGLQRALRAGPGVLKGRRV